MEEETYSPENQHRITRLLSRLSGGNRQAVDELFPLVYQELHQIAHHYMSMERPGHTLNTTALVHEAYLKLVGSEAVHWENRAHFFAIAARAMRRILVSYARKHHAARRGGRQKRLSLEAAEPFIPAQKAEEILALDEALQRLESLDSRKSLIVEYRYFGGLTIEETARVLDLTVSRIKQEWRLARAWLFREINGEVSP